MKNILAAILCLLSPPVFSQTDSDTTIYAVAENMPLALLASCQPAKHPGWNVDSVRRCTDLALMSLVAQNIRYPAEAREKNIQGLVVTNFVVEKNGRLTHPNVLKDIGGGCGPEAIRVLKALDEAGLRWVPGTQAGQPVRVSVTLPLRFRVEAAKPYVISTYGDTVYTEVEAVAEFRGGLDSLARYIINRVVYPKNWADSCKTGIIETSLLVLPDGDVRVENQLDFNNLGGDFQFNAIRLLNRTADLWVPAKFQGRDVATTLPVRIPFKSAAPGCRTVNDNFEKAILLANEATALSEAEKNEEALAKFTEALRLHPRNTELHYYRGNLLLAMNRKDAGCEDFAAVKKILGYTWFETFGRLICGW